MSAPEFSASRRDLARLVGLGAAWAALRPFADGPLLAAESAATGPLVYLNFNENPFGPPPAALAALAATTPLLCRYPDRAEEELTAALAAEAGVATEQVALGAGSNQILHAAANAWCGPGRCAAIADPTFEAVGSFAEVRGAEVKRVPLTADFRHDLAAMGAAVGDAGVVYVCNPNNPTASLTPAGELRALLDRLPSGVVVVVDEAYHHYAVESAGYESVLPWLATYPNLVVARTFSKIYGMAGLRVGCAFGSAARIAELRRQLSWIAVNVQGLVAARAALGDRDHVAAAARANAARRETVLAALAKRGARAIPSAANFFMVDLGRDVRPVIERLQAAGVVVGRRFAALPTHLRVTVGTDVEMEAFLSAYGRVAAG